MDQLAQQYLGRAGSFVADVIPKTLNPFKGSPPQEPLALWAAEWNRLPVATLVLIEERAPIISERLQATAVGGLADTDTAAELWRREFDQAGIPVQLISGLYQPAESAESPIEHVWLQVDGLLVDPTAGQYGAPADSFDYYQQRTIEAS